MIGVPPYHYDEYDYGIDETEFYLGFKELLEKKSTYADNMSEIESIIIKTLYYDIHELVDKILIQDENNIALELAGENLWSSIYHQTYGLCYTLNLSKAEKDLNSVEDSLTISFKLKDIRNDFGGGWGSSYGFYKQWYALLHHSNDLPSADIKSSKLSFDIASLSMNQVQS